jgi:RNAse (barnase) inhibitor barstar
VPRPPARCGHISLDEPSAVRTLLIVTEVYVLDGERIGSLEDFWAVVGKAMGCGGYFGRSLDAFADCLSGGFGTPEDGDFVVVWRAHDSSRAALGYPETARQLESMLGRCHPSHRERIRGELDEARAGRGPTVFDWLVEIFDERVPGQLRLE